MEIPVHPVVSQLNIFVFQLLHNQWFCLFLKIVNIETWNFLREVSNNSVMLITDTAYLSLSFVNSRLQVRFSPITVSQTHWLMWYPCTQQSFSNVPVAIYVNGKVVQSVNQLEIIFVSVLSPIAMNKSLRRSGNARLLCWVHSVVSVPQDKRYV